ncbi:C-type lectin domain family 2 member H-like [Peromyscus leucopus]|uniref:C-type lectin domain family 2 member H-like n=1 Tax=Peromyscus leucopus TaxID=10041 RepID=UPI0010A1A066|nr:C-type lectin domain family 2 member H-like [Peromyscus leucopus]
MRLSSEMPGAAATKDSTCMPETVSIATDLFQEEETGKKLQVQCLRILSPESPVKLYCCYAVIAILTAAVIALSVALSERPVNKTCGPCHTTCPRDWIGFGSKCFYFSEDVRSWTFSQTSCMAQEAHLARFDSLEELNFLKRHKGDSDHWIDLYRESPEHSWRWTNNTEYNNLVPIRGEGECVYLSDNGISSGRSYTYRKWICSKPQLSFTRANGF